MLANQKKRILILTHEFLPFRGGVATYCGEMAENAAAMGHDVTVMCPEYIEYPDPQDHLRSYKVIRFKSEQSHIKRMLRLSSIYLKINPKDWDAIHACEWITIVALHLFWPIKKLHAIATVHGSDVYFFETMKLMTKLRGKDFFRNIVRVTANSQYTANLFKQYHPYYPDKDIRVTLLGVNDYWYQSAGDVSSVLQKFGVPANRKLLLTVSRLDERKGHRGVLKALALLPPSIKDQLAYVVVGRAGDANYLEELKTLAAQSGVPVVFTGGIERDEVRAFYSAAWLYCMLGEETPQKIEGFGLSYLEAAAQSLPSLARPLGGIPEVVLHEKTGIIVEDPDPKAVATIIEQLAADPTLVDTYGRNALQWAKSFTWQRCVEQTYDGIGDKS